MKFLSRSILLFFLFLTSYSFGQVTISIEVRWDNWSSENRVTFRNPADGQIGNSICNPATCFDGSTDNSYNNIGNRETYTNVPYGNGYDLFLEDTFGDGWNGASYVRVYQDNVLIVNTDLINGNERTVTFNIQPPAPEIIISDVTVDEDAGTAIFTATHTDVNASGPFTVNYTTQNGSATAGSDYTFTNGTLNFNGVSGDTNQIFVPILNNPGIENNETFTIIFTSSSDASVDISDTATGNIIDPANSPRPYEERQSINVQGNFKMRGNTNIVCVSNCPENPDTNNPPAVMGYVNVDTSRINSSSSTMTLPAGATVEYAGLYWGGVYQSTRGGITNPPASLSMDEVKLRTPAGTAYTNIAAEVRNVERTAQSPWDTFLAYANVTAQVQAGGSGDYFVADIALATGSAFTGPSGGWTMVIIYNDPAEKTRNIALWDGFDFFGFGDNETFTVTDLLTPSAGAFESHAGYFAFDGEAGPTYDGDYVEINGNRLSNALNPANNALNGTISEFGVNTGGRNPNLNFSWGMDIDTYDASGFVPNGANSLNVELGSANEGIWGGVFVTSNEIAFPAVSVKTFVPSSVYVGEESLVDIVIENPSNGTPLTGFALTDNFPPGMTLSSTPDASSSCGGMITANPGANSFSISGVNIPAGTTCTFTFDVVAASAGTYDNTISPSDVSNNQNIPLRGESTGTLTVQPLIDTDNDGLNDNVDLDDDNDGILDANEEVCGPSVGGFDAYWSLENNSNDSSGNNHNTTAENISYSTDSHKGANAAAFNGTSSYLRYSDGTFLNQQITDFSYSFWIRPANLSGIQTLMEEGSSTNGIAVRLNGNILESGVREGGGTLSTSSFTFPNDGKWHHIGLTYANGIVVMYLDGSASTALSTGFGALDFHGDGQHFARTQDTDAFGAGTGNYYEGLMDELVHYPIALSNSQMNMMYNTACDTDNDGVPNRLDSDADDDGCADAIEGAAPASQISSADLDGNDRITGGVNGDGVPNLANGGQDAGTAFDDTQQAPDCDPCGPGNPDFTDADGDGLGDRCDLDDDNDGIPDCVENGTEGSTINEVFQLNGDAVQISDFEVQLTAAANGQSGFATIMDRIDFSNSFNFDFEAFLGTKDGNGADGIAIIFHNDPAGSAAVGTNGQGLGASSIQDGIVLELDTFDNGGAVGDIGADHGQIWDSDLQSSCRPF